MVCCNRMFIYCFHLMIQQLGSDINYLSKIKNFDLIFFNFPLTKFFQSFSMLKHGLKTIQISLNKLCCNLFNFKPRLTRLKRNVQENNTFLNCVTIKPSYPLFSFQFYQNIFLKKKQHRSANCKHSLCYFLQIFDLYVHFLFIFVCLQNKPKILKCIFNRFCKFCLLKNRLKQFVHGCLNSSIFCLCTALNAIFTDMLLTVSHQFHFCLII